MHTATSPTAEPALSALPPDTEKLQRDLTSAHVRNRTLMRALTRAAAAPTIVGVLPGPDREFDEIVFLSNGIKLEHRWSRETGWRYVQAACVPGTLADIVDQVFAEPLAARLGMTMVSG